MEVKNNLSVFNFNGSEVRTVLVDNEPWFVLADVCNVLELTSPHKVANRLDDDEKGRTSIPTLGGNQEATIINESGLYTVILRSDKPQAKSFRKWVTSEVLPSIRKTGGYKIPTNSFEAMELMFNIQKEQQQAIEEVKTATAENSQRLTDLEDNSVLSPSEYSYLCRCISDKVHSVKRERGLEHATRAQNAELFKAINKEIKQVAGVSVRSQIRKKDFEKVLNFVNDWQPSSATSFIINQLELSY